MAPEGKENKRKAVAAVAADAPQAKKTKKSKVPSAKLTKEDAIATPNSAADLLPSKPTEKAEVAISAKIKPRKRAVDFLSDEEERGDGVRLKASEIEAPSSEKPKKKRTKKDKVAVNADLSEPIVQAEVAETARPDPVDTSAKGAIEARPRSKKTKTAPESQEISSKNGKIAASSGPKKKGPSTANVHAEKIKKLLSQKDKVITKPKKTDSNVQADLTTNGVNGVSTNAADETLKAAADDVAPTSMQSEAQQTTERELEEEYGNDEELDQASALLEGFDSDTEDPAQDVGFDKAKPTAALPNYKKTQKKLKQAAQKGSKEGPGAVYVGRIPHGFYENEMRQYFSQFGTITKLRLSRNRKTGQSKHFAFLEFESTEVAKIVAETMDNYLMFGHILKCKYVQPEYLHPETFKGANKRFHVVPRNKIEKRALEAPKTESQWKKKNEKEQAKREKKAKQLKAMGYELELPELKSPEEALRRKQSQSASEEQGPNTSKTDENEAPAPSATPKDEAVAIGKKKSNGEKKEMIGSAEINGANIPSTASKDETSERTEPQDSHKAEPGRQKKRKEKREKGKIEANQPAAPVTVNETLTIRKEADSEPATAKADSVAATRNSKPKKKENRKETAQAATAETSSAPALAVVEVAAPSATTAPSAPVEDSKSKKTRRKRKHDGSDDQVAEPGSKATEPSTTDEKKERVDGEARSKKGILKRAKKA